MAEEPYLASLGSDLQEIGRALRDGDVGRAQALLAAALAVDPREPACRIAALLLDHPLPPSDVATTAAPEASLSLLMQHPPEPAAAARLVAALSGIEAAPSAIAPRIEAACLLLVINEPHWAEQALLPVWRESASDGRLARVLSGVWSVLSRTEDALRSARIAAEALQQDAEAQVHLAGLLLLSRQPAEALLAAGRAIGIDPDYALGWRKASAAMLEMGHVEAAIWLSRRAAARSDEQRRLLEEIVVSTSATIAPPPGPPPPPEGGTPDWARPPDDLPPVPRPGMAHFVRTRLRIVDALMLREARTMFTHTRLGYAWALFEPMMHVFVLSVALSVMGANTQPPIGDYLPLFYMTGVLPYLFFCHLTERGMDAARANRAVLNLSVVSLGDVLVARLVLRAATDIVVLIVTLGIFIALDLAALPADTFAMVCAYLCLFAFSFGLGMMNMVASSFTGVLDKLWPIMLRAQYFVSGIFYHPDMMPPEVREMLLWNPLMHFIEWVREAYFPLYVSPYLDTVYLVQWTAGLLLFGLLAMLAARRHMRTPH